jgi:hypothetical protein
MKLANDPPTERSSSLAVLDQVPCAILVAVGDRLDLVMWLSAVRT